jgi:hypothetical protein
MYILSKPFIYIAVLTAALSTITTSVYASPQKEMHKLMLKYEKVGRIDEINKTGRTVTISGNTYNLAAGVTLLGMGAKNKYNLDALKTGMQVGYKLMYNSSNTISELWVMPE